MRGIIKETTTERKIIEPEQPYDGILMPVIIDGNYKQIKVKKILISRMLKQDGDHVGIPI